MSKCILSYSMTGNNDALAKRIAKATGAQHIAVTERKRSVLTIILDVVFGRVPKTQQDVSMLDGFDEVIFVGPVWMEKAASPLRKYLLYIKERNLPYKFVTISGGSLHKNPKLKDDIVKYGGENLTLLKDMYISDLLGKDEVTMKETSGYKLTDDDLKAIALPILEAL